MKRVVTFGEVMLRLSPPDYSRLMQTRTLDMTFGGAELNVAVSLARLGVPSAFVTKLPENDVAEACITEIRGLGVGTAHIRRGGGRMGVYYVERGAAQRGSTVIYDRKNSAIAESDPGEWDWRTVLGGATALHVTGITPALSQNCRIAMHDALTVAKEIGVTTFFDLNYRQKLWSTKDAGKVLAELLPLATHGVVSDHDADTLFGIRSKKTDTEKKQAEVAEKLTKRFGLTGIAMTRREQHSASRNGWGGMFYVGGSAHVSRQYEIDFIVDRVGGGDAFTAGIIYGVVNNKKPQDTVEFAAAASCLKHSIAGDYNLVTVAEVESLVGGDGSGRVQR
ncbi:MAG: sugar kinase [Akkermansiaceae bacterium]|nr:sugar kinase [Armatimonadota bacterium]